MDKFFQSFSINQRMVANLAVSLIGMLCMLWLVFSQTSQLGELAHKAWLSESLNSGLLTLRRNEKDFLMRLDMKYATKFEDNYHLLLSDIDEYLQFEPKNSEVKSVRQQIQSYQAKFHELIAVQKLIGLNPKDGYYGALREAVHAIEDSVKARQDQHLLYLTLQLRRREKDFMLRLDTSYVEKFNADIIEFKQVLSSSNFDTATKAVLSNTLNNYQSTFLAFVEGMKTKGLDANSGALGELRKTVHQAEKAMSTLITDTKSDMTQTISDSHIYALIIALTITVIVCSLIFFSSRSILQPILTVSRRIAEIRASNNLTVRIPLQGKDEIAAMVVHFNSLIDDFQHLVTDVDKTLTTLDGAVNGLTEIADKTQQEMNHQLLETDMVATAVTEMRTTIDEIAQNTEQAAHKSNEANNNAKDSYTEVMQTASSINELSSQLSEAGNVVLALDQDAKNIGSVLDVIRGIAEQTNLLALNAAIEAARAGDQGRGFAVVADEVRNLAMRTQESTREIEQIIKTLQSRTNNVVGLMQQCRQQGDSSSSQAKKTGDLLLQITSDVTVISDMSAQIAAATEEQSKVASEVNENIVRIRDIADKSNQNTLTIVTFSEGVANQAGILVNAVHKFKK